MPDTLTLAPLAWAEWLPLGKAAGFFLATFVLEDAAVVGAGWLLALGDISWPAAFTACFLGIWLGDAGLYVLARLAGRAWFERSRLQKFSTQVTRSEKWFTAHGPAILIFSRCVPGTRLPTYLAAGFLRVPATRFLWITGCAALGWTFFILLAVQTLGAQLTPWLARFKSIGLAVLVVGASGFIVLPWWRKRASKIDFQKVSAWIDRWRHWEFWPAWLFYPPVAIYYLWLAFKYRGLMLPTAANPGIFSGGIVGESKSATLRDLMSGSPAFTAEAELLTGATATERLASLAAICARRNLNYPFILKPDLGQRGAGIKLIRHPAQAEAYLAQTDAALLVQRFAPGPHEAGIYYYRFPGKTRGHIFGITEKIFPTVIGDGKSTVAALVWRDPRARFMAAKYLARLDARQADVLPAGQTLKLVEAGNHAQGCIFRDGAHLATPALAERIDDISQKVGGFFVGRYDIRYASADELRAGKNFQIIELNGAAAEAANIYDARNSLWTAYRTLFRQWDLVFAIGAANRRRGAATTSPFRLWQAWRHYARTAATYPAAD